ncbi:uncharacterized protein LOC107042045 [Diachasma alloeum]|uniref:uncharacterized protein LOC107042045 n=1 Tax=Diachasma alloeum TaxID=454923 RepID=UPI0007382B44|nr:uncharacterized protein LOC107042045 [Diachasma alloeum]
MKLSPITVEPNKKPIYLSHHAVLRTDSTTSPLKVVFNASSKTTNGTTLNDHMYVRPQILPELLDIILRWRMHVVALRADAEKMFRQILVTPEQTHLQRILWQQPNKNEVESFDLITVTYKTVPAPFLANRVLKQLGDDESTQFPSAADVLRRNIYVDDLFTGTNSIPEARQLQEQLRLLLKAGGFNLRKWASSHPGAWESVDTPRLAKNTTLKLNYDETVKVLGIYWNISQDSFQFNVQTGPQGGTTKREILSSIAKIFDSVSRLTPTTISAKIMMQELWITGIDWDETGPDEIITPWSQSLQSVSRPTTAENSSTHQLDN